MSISAALGPVVQTSTHRVTQRSVAVWSLTQFILFTATLVVLGSAIGWPGILREPAAKVLSVIHDEALATALGYSLYLLASVALIGLALALGRELKHQGSDKALVDLITTLGVASGVLKTLGIVRWLSVMPTLATAYAAPDTAPTLLPVIELLYTSFNAYAGAVGELLGVQLFSGLWLAGVSVLLLLRRGWKLTALLGLVTGALLLVCSLRIFFDGLGVVNAIVGPLGLAWYLVLAIAAWRQPGKPHA